MTLDFCRLETGKWKSSFHSALEAKFKVWEVGSRGKPPFLVLAGLSSLSSPMALFWADQGQGRSSLTAVGAAGGQALMLNWNCCGVLFLSVCVLELLRKAERIDE